MSEQAETVSELTVDDIVPRLEKLEEMLKVAAPELEYELMQLNEDLRQYPELVFALSDEQIAPLYKALLRKTNTEIKVKTSRKRGKNNLLDDGSSVADAL